MASSKPPSSARLSSDLVPAGPSARHPCAHLPACSHRAPPCVQLLRRRRRRRRRSLPAVHVIRPGNFMADRVPKGYSRLRPRRLHHQLGRGAICMVRGPLRKGQLGPDGTGVPVRAQIFGQLTNRGLGQPKGLERQLDGPLGFHTVCCYDLSRGTKGPSWAPGSLPKYATRLPRSVSPS